MFVKLSADSSVSLEDRDNFRAFKLVVTGNPAKLDAARKEVAALSLPGDELSAKGREIYWGRFGKLSESPLFGKSLGKTVSAGTMRNRNTVVRLLARMQGAPALPPAGGRRSKKELS